MTTVEQFKSDYPKLADVFDQETILIIIELKNSGELTDAMLNSTDANKIIQQYIEKQTNNTLTTTAAETEVPTTTAPVTTTEAPTNGNPSSNETGDISKSSVYTSNAKVSIQPNDLQTIYAGNYNTVSGDAYKYSNNINFGEASNEIFQNVLTTTEKQLVYSGHNDIIDRGDSLNSKVYAGENGIIFKGLPNVKTGRPKYIYEDVSKWPSVLLSHLNEYMYIYDESAVHDSGSVLESTAVSKKITADSDVKKQNAQVDKLMQDADTVLTETVAAPSLFNPAFFIPAVGYTEDLPLLMNTKPRSVSVGGHEGVGKGAKHVTNAVTAFIGSSDRWITNCTINELVRVSETTNKFGKGRYKFADFMYCKDLGKISNNHLITLRRFSSPIGDNIFKTAGKGYASNETLNDIGRLVTWFGTDDNKLEDILKYSYKMTWKPYKAEIQQKDSEADSASTGPLGALLNTLNPSYNSMQGAGRTGTGNIMSMLGSKMSVPFIGGTFGGAGQYQNHEMYKNYDHNKVYEPKNTIQDNNIYEGKLEFTHEFNIKFCYKLRAYDNINPKSAFLDLIANILVVTYQKGHYWGGARQVVGPPQNTAGWNKAKNLINGAFDKLDGLVAGLASGSMDFGQLLSSIGSAIKGAASAIAGGVRDAAKQIAKDGFSGTMNKILQKGAAFVKDKNLTQAIKGQLMNTLGRPAVYCFDSIIGGGDVGMWHLTIGNPKNPIAAIGNLIMTNASITQSGPLGIDDFPTDLTVTVSLKPGRSRDATEIQRMYTKGVNSIYISNTLKTIENYYRVKEAGASRTVIDSNGNAVTQSWDAMVNQMIKEEKEADMAIRKNAEQAAAEKAKAAAAENAKKKAESTTAAPKNNSTTPSSNQTTQAAGDSKSSTTAAPTQPPASISKDSPGVIDVNQMKDQLERYKQESELTIARLKAIHVDGAIDVTDQGFYEQTQSNVNQLSGIDSALWRRHVGPMDDPIQIFTCFADSGNFG